MEPKHYGNVELMKLLLQGFRVAYWWDVDNQYTQVQLGITAGMVGTPIIRKTCLI